MLEISNDLDSFPPLGPGFPFPLNAQNIPFHVKDWSASRLGPPEAWPSSLKAALGVIFAAPLPMLVLWGPDLIQFYNESYAKACGPCHPLALGRTVRECCPNRWDMHALIYDAVWRGETRSHPRQTLTVDPLGESETTSFDLTYSPLRDALGATVGILVTAVESTERQSAEAALNDLNSALKSQIVSRTAERDLLATIVESTDVLIMAVDLEHNILALNAANANEFARIYGVRPKAGDNMLALLEGQPEHQEEVRQAWSRGLAGDEFTVVEEFGDPRAPVPSMRSPSGP